VAFYSQSIFVGLLGVAMMFGSAVIFERNLRRMGKAGWADFTRSLHEDEPSGSTGGSRRRCTGPGTGSAPVSCDAIADPVRAVDQAVLAVDIGGTKMAPQWSGPTAPSRAPPIADPPGAGAEELFSVLTGLTTSAVAEVGAIASWPVASAAVARWPRWRRGLAPQHHRLAGLPPSSAPC